jgi:hypothetical protein
MSRKQNCLPNIFSKTIRNKSGCLLYTGALDKDGYPRISYRGHMRLGSHLVFELASGVIPEGYQVDHICHTRRCIEPTHLRLLTRRQNVIYIKAYVEKRNQRIKQLIETYPQIKLFPLLITLEELEALWDCGSTAQVKARLRTMSKAFPEEFFYERLKEGQGRNPDLYAIGIHPSLIDKLPNEDALRETPAEDIMTLMV